MEIKDFSTLAQAQKDIEAITKNALESSIRVVHLAGESVWEQIKKYLHETLTPIYNSEAFNSFYIYNQNPMSLLNGKWFINKTGQVQGFHLHIFICSEAHCSVFFTAGGIIEVRSPSDRAITYMAENWTKIKEDILCRIENVLKEDIEKKKRIIADQKAKENIIVNFKI